MTNKKDIGYLRLLVDLKKENTNNEKINSANNEVYFIISRILENLHFNN